MGKSPKILMPVADENCRNKSTVCRNAFYEIVFMVSDFRWAIQAELVTVYERVADLK